MWTIEPLHVGTLFLTKVGQNYHYHRVNDDASNVSGVPCIVWLLKNNETGKIILVDAGPSEDPKRDSMLHGKIERKPEQQLAYLLAQRNIQLTDVEEIILTHLHWDHMLGVLIMPQAKVIVQKKELEYSLTPYPFDYAPYELNDATQEPPVIRFLKQIEVVDGKQTLGEGIELIPIPGHTVGSQGVLVDCGEKRYFITGDLLDSYHNMKDEAPTCLFSSLDEFYSSLNLVKQLDRQGVIILPGHDMEVWQHFERSVETCGN